MALFYNKGVYISKQQYELEVVEACLNSQQNSDKWSEHFAITEVLNLVQIWYLKTVNLPIIQDEIKQSLFLKCQSKFNSGKSQFCTMVLA